MKKVILGTFLAVAMHLPVLVNPAMAMSSDESARMVMKGSLYGGVPMSAVGSAAVASGGVPAGIAAASAAGFMVNMLNDSKGSRSIQAKPRKLKVDDESVTRGAR